MKLNPILENAYKSMLKYAMLYVHEDGSIVSPGKNIAIKVKNGNALCLPYSELLDNTAGRTFFHILNEHYDMPEIEQYLIYRHHVIEAVNLRLFALMTTLIDICSSKEKQELIRNGDFLRLVGEIGETTLDQCDVIENLYIKAGAENGVGRFIDFFQKKPGKIDDITYDAICKTNFVLYRDICTAIEEQSGSYKLYGLSLRKKDLLLFKKMLEILFPNITDSKSYSDGSNNKTFGYLNSLLTTTYITSSLMNQAFSLIKEDMVLSEEGEDESKLIADLEWVGMLENLYASRNVICSIPQQIDIANESPAKKTISAPGKLKLNESAASTPVVNSLQPSAATIPTYNPPPLNTAPLAAALPPTLPTTTTPATESLEARLNNPLSTGMSALNLLNGGGNNLQALAQMQQLQQFQQLQNQQALQVKRNQEQQVLKNQALAILQATFAANPMIQMQAQTNPQLMQELFSQALQQASQATGITLIEHDAFGALLNSAGGINNPLMNGSANPMTALLGMAQNNNANLLGSLGLSLNGANLGVNNMSGNGPKFI